MNTSPGVTPVRLPRQVLRAKARADELSQQAVDALASGETPEPQSGAPEVTTPAQTPSPEPVDFATAEPATPEGRYWRQRFKVTEGLFRAAREQHATALELRDATVAELRGEVARLQSSQASEAPVQDISQFLTPQQIEELGEDQASAIVSTAIKAAREQAAALVKAELEPIRARHEAAEQKETRKRAETFTDALDAGFPEWREVDTDPRWLAFLDGVDEATDLERQQVIDLAKEKQNAKPIVRLLKEFQRSLGALETMPPSVVPSGGAAGGGSPSSVDAPVEGGIPTGAEIKQHFKLRALGKIKEDEARKFDARLKAADAANMLRR